MKNISDGYAEELQRVLSGIRFDFGREFDFEGLHFLVSEEELGKLREGQAQVLPQQIHDCRVTVFTGGRHRKVVYMERSVPTFDSGDREYDSWHDLYLICDKPEEVQGIYCTGGYRIAKLLGLKKLLDCPEEIRKLLE